ncbi:DUF421 domain-containing protein [soil metagenome]
MEWFDSFYIAIGEAEGDIGWAEMSVRAVVIFIYGVIATRVGAWRAFGRWSSPDIIVAIIIGSNLSRALTGPAPLVSTILATTVFIAAYWLLSFAASRSPWLDWLFKGSPVTIISDGSVDHKALRRAVLIRRDLDEALRQKGISQDSRVATALLERNGSITVIRNQHIQ